MANETLDTLKETLDALDLVLRFMSDDELKNLHGKITEHISDLEADQNTDNRTSMQSAEIVRNQIIFIQNRRNPQTASSEPDL